MPTPDTIQAPLSTRDELLAVATDLIQEYGFASFSFRDLAQRVGIKAPSIHYHFPTKSDLGVAVVEWGRQLSRQRAQDYTARYPDIRERLLAIAERCAEETCNRGRSCPLYALHAEFSVLPEPVQRATQAWTDERVAIIAEWLDEARRLGQLHFPGSAEDQAKLVWSVFQYGSQLARTGTNQSFLHLINHLLATMAQPPGPESPCVIP